MKVIRIIIPLLILGCIIISGCTNNNTNLVKKDEPAQNLTLGKDVFFYFNMMHANNATNRFNADFFNGTMYYNKAKNENDPVTRKKLFTDSRNSFYNAETSLQKAHNYYENATNYVNSTGEGDYLAIVKEQNDNLDSITLILINASNEWLKDKPDNSTFDSLEKEISQYTEKVNNLDIEKSRLEKVINDTKQKMLQNSTGIES